MVEQQQQVVVVEEEQEEEDLFAIELGMFTIGREMPDT